MIIKILNEINSLPERFVIWFKTDLKCPECGKEGLVLKYRCNGKIGFSHSSSGIILACENWENCKSWWNKGEEDRFPWHTWLSSFHKMLDIDRGNHGEMFLKNVSLENQRIYNKILSIDREINRNTRK